MVSEPVMVITGTSRGVGRSLAEYYARRGYRVVGCSRGGIDVPLDNYQHYHLNVSDESAIGKMHSKIRRQYGRLDVLINNAGIAPTNHVLLTSSREVMESFNTNYLGTLLFSRESVKLMKANSFGRIVSLSSVHVPLALEGSAVYGGTKAAIEQLSRVMAREVFRFGITVNVLSLSVVQHTGMANTLTEENRNRVLRHTTTRQQIDISDITNAVDFLIDKKSGMVTNQILCLGGS